MNGARIEHPEHGTGLIIATGTDSVTARFGSLDDPPSVQLVTIPSHRLAACTVTIPGPQPAEVIGPDRVQCEHCPAIVPRRSLDVHQVLCHPYTRRRP